MKHCFYMNYKIIIEYRLYIFWESGKFLLIGQGKSSVIFCGHLASGPALRDWKDGWRYCGVGLPGIQRVPIN